MDVANPFCHQDTQEGWSRRILTWPPRAHYIVLADFTAKPIIPT
jgi:hypothetical protein